MPYTYPAPRTGTAQDLLRVVTRAWEIELEKTGTTLPHKSDWQRRWIEPFFRALGVLFAKVMEIVPADWTVAFHDWVYARLAAPRSYAFDPTRSQIARARALAEALKGRSGREPALLAMISHPPVMGELAHLNFELVRHATLALRAVRGRPCRPRLVAATDPFALDTTAIAAEGIYAGYMGTFHIGVDRLALGRGQLGPALTPQASWSAMPLRLFRVLAEGGEIGLVLAGGVPTTGRVLYGVREWIRGARRKSPRVGRPVDVERALEAEESFRRFQKTVAGVVFVPPGTWRLVDAWLMAVAAGLLGGESVRDAAAAALKAFAIPAADQPALLADLERNLVRETPHRRRLFRLLAGRVARRRPVLMIPVVHRTSPLGIEVGEAWSWEWLGSGRVAARKADAPETAVETTAVAFADRFVEENFA